MKTACILKTFLPVSLLLLLASCMSKEEQEKRLIDKIGKEVEGTYKGTVYSEGSYLNEEKGYVPGRYETYVIKITKLDGKKLRYQSLSPDGKTVGSTYEGELNISDTSYVPPFGYSSDPRFFNIEKKTLTMIIYEKPVALKKIK